jgi:hypothetical protein
VAGPAAGLPVEMQVCTALYVYECLIAAAADDAACVCVCECRGYQSRGIEVDRLLLWEAAAANPPSAIFSEVSQGADAAAVQHRVTGVQHVCQHPSALFCCCMRQYMHDFELCRLSTLSAALLFCMGPCQANTAHCFSIAPHDCRDALTYCCHQAQAAHAPQHHTPIPSTACCA